MRTLAAVLLLLSTAPLCHAQRLSSGVTADQFRDQMEYEANWQKSKKLSLTAIPAEIALPTSQGDNPDNLNEKQVGNLAYWQFHVTSIVDEKNAILRLGPSTYWLTDYPTKGLVDDETVRLIGPVMCAGSKKYTTVLGGSSTVKVLRFVTQAELVKQEQDKADAEEALLWGTWHSKAGTTVHAKFIAWKSGKVHLLTKDGHKLIVDISAFTEDDAKKLRELNRDSRSKK